MKSWKAVSFYKIFAYRLLLTETRTLFRNRCRREQCFVLAAQRKGYGYKMKLHFRIDWGYQYLYSRRHYHPVFRWDGKLSCSGGVIENTYQLDYPVIWYGPGQSAKETLLEKPEWRSSTKRGMAGIRVEADVEKDAVFVLETSSGVFRFTASEINGKGRIEFPVGNPFLGCFVIVTRTDYLWFRREPKPGEKVFEYSDLSLPVHEWARMKLAWLAPGGSVDMEVEIPECSADYRETIFHTIAMGAPDYSPEKETQVDGEMPFTLLCDGAAVLDYARYYRKHDFFLQLLEDDWKRVKLPAGRHTLTLINRHPSFSLAISRIVLSQAEYSHGQLSMPEWALNGEKVIGKVFAAWKDTFQISAGTETISVACSEGWNEFLFTAAGDGISEVKCGSFTAKLEVYNCGREKYPVKVGYDMLRPDRVK